MLSPTVTCAPFASSRFRIGIQYSAVEAITATKPISANSACPIQNQPAAAATIAAAQTT
ncbi:MAG: hypothetical protein M9921_09855 [Fimbriimonadaceae bacterium]|nr:hypothetical protein [Chthonomonadaceae bacterium]MCO5297148.1 hypothetical protein [Fimbriimonadaceae bacterium]